MSSQATPLGKPSPHDSAVLHVTGRAHYVDDRPHQRGQLVAFIVGSPMAHGELIELSVDAALETPGVHTILTHQDIPGINDASPLAHDEELLVSKTAIFKEQPVALIAGESLEACREAAGKIKMDFRELPHILTIEDAIAQESFFGSRINPRRWRSQSRL